MQKIFSWFHRVQVNPSINTYSHHLSWPVGHSWQELPLDAGGDHLGGHHGVHQPPHGSVPAHMPPTWLSRGWGEWVVLYNDPSVPQPVVQSRRRPLLGPSPGWKRLLALSHLRHYAERSLTPRSLNVKLGPRHNYHKGPNFTLRYRGVNACLA